MVAQPPWVHEAKVLATRLGFDTKCSDEAGSLLRLLAATRPGGRIGEIGSGCGVGTAWLLSGCAPNSQLITVERQPARAAAVQAIFAADARVTVLSGDWELIVAHAPFDLLFVDAAPPKHQHREVVPRLVAPGGIVVLDDLTPLPDVPDGAKTHDPVRSFWYGLPGWTATEFRISTREAVLLAVRLVTLPEGA